MRRTRNRVVRTREESELQATSPAAPPRGALPGVHGLRPRTTIAALLLFGLALAPLRSSPAPRIEDVWQDWIRFYSRLNLILAGVTDAPSMQRAVSSLRELGGEIRAIQEREQLAASGDSSEHVGDAFLALMNIQKSFDGNLRRIALNPELEAPIRSALNDLFLCLRPTTAAAG